MPNQRKTRLSKGVVYAVLPGSVFASLATTAAHAVCGDLSFYAAAQRSQNIERGSSGQPIFVEYDAGGKPIRSLGEAVGPLQGVYPISAVRYQAYLDACRDYRDYRSRYAEQAFLQGAQLLTAEAYTTANLLSVDGRPVSRPALAQSTCAVLVRHASQ